MTDISSIKLPKGSRVVRSKGIDYVATHIYWWDKEKKRGQQKRTTIGKIVDGKFVPNARYLAEQKYEKERARAQKLEKFDADKSFGDVALLIQASRETGLLEDYCDAFGIKYGTLMVCMAAYEINSRTSALNGFEIFARTHALPVELTEDLESQRISEACKAIGADTDAANRLFALRAARITEDEYLSYDSTRIASQSRNLGEAKKGPSKEGGFENQIGFALLYGHSSRLPVMFRRFPGNVNDIKTLHDLLTRWESLGLDKAVTPVFDRGYCSKENIRLLNGGGLRFIMAAKTDNSCIRQAIEDHMPEFWDMANTLEVDDITGVRCRVKIPEFEDDRSLCEVWAYLFFSPTREGREQKEFMAKLREFESSWDAGTASASSTCLKYYEKPSGEPGTCKLARDYSAINEKVRYLGFFAVLSNSEMDISEAHDIYTQRDCIEKCFRSLKSDIGLKCTRGHSLETVNARLLVGFAAATITSWLNREMSVEKKIGRKTFPPLRDEFSLKDLLAELSQVRHFKTKTGGGKAWIGEVIKRHREIYERLGLEKVLDDPGAFK